jgi:hypothetical protein
LSHKAVLLVKGIDHRLHGFFIGGNHLAAKPAMKVVVHAVDAYEFVTSLPLSRIQHDDKSQVNQEIKRAVNRGEIEAFEFGMDALINIFRCRHFV